MNYEEHPWLMAIIIALILLLIVGFLVGYVVLLQWIWPISEIAFILLMAFPILVILIKRHVV